MYATADIERGVFICEYGGRYIKTKREALKIESNYVFLLDTGGAWDATPEDSGIGRYINHSRLRPNLIVRGVRIKRRKHIFFYAARKIRKGEELLYDYGWRDVTISWLANS